MIYLIVALMAYSALPHPQPGTYQLVPQGDAVLRIDTRTGAIERCVITDKLVCTTVNTAP